MPRYWVETENIELEQSEEDKNQEPEDNWSVENNNKYSVTMVNNDTHVIVSNDANYVNEEALGGERGLFCRSREEFVFHWELEKSSHNYSCAQVITKVVLVY